MTKAVAVITAVDDADHHVFTPNAPNIHGSLRNSSQAVSQKKKTRAAVPDVCGSNNPTPTAMQTAAFKYASADRKGIDSGTGCQPGAKLPLIRQRIPQPIKTTANTIVLIFPITFLFR